MLTIANNRKTVQLRPIITSLILQVFSHEPKNGTNKKFDPMMELKRKSSKVQLPE